MNGMKKILALLLACAAFTACQDDLFPGQTGTAAEGMVDIYLSSPAMPHIVTRADGQDDVDNRVDNVILFAFDTDGNLLNNPVQQTVTESTAVNGLARYKFRAYLPSGYATLRAVCNYDDPDGLIAEVSKDRADNESDEQALLDYRVNIENAEDAFKGVYVMEGRYPETDGTTPSGSPVIKVYRTVSRHQFTITFDPDNKDDEFKMINLAVFNVPNTSYLVGRGDDDANADAAGDVRANYIAPQMADGTAEAGNVPEDAIALDFTTTDANPADNDIEYAATTHLYENRHGVTDDSRVDEALSLTDHTDEQKESIRQVFKHALAKGTAPYAETDAHDYASCLVIQGMYEDKVNGKGFEVTYYVYLGKNNYSDFNVCRNTDYTYHITIRACDELDTRVDAEAVGEIEFSVSKASEPFDAHFNVRETLLRSTRGWTVAVIDPDKTPWLEISKSPIYHGRKLSPEDQPDSSIRPDEYAQFSLTSDASGLEYIYIHTDEYVPDLATGYKDGYGNNEYYTEKNKELNPRVGEIVYYHSGQTKEDAIDEGQVFKVVQYPAQIVLVTERVWNAGAAEWKEIPHYFFIERILEEKYKNWGFYHHWSRELDELISRGTFDGLDASRHEYVTAYWGDPKSDSYEARIEFDPLPESFQYYATEAYENAAYWEDTNEDDDYTDEDKTITNLIPSSTALGYALLKNRDRNGNGRIDHDEIVWYLPARHQLEAIHRALRDGGKDEYSDKTLRVYGLLTGEDADENGLPDGEYGDLSLDGGFWSSTPSASDKYGITPGRAYYVEMSGEEGKSGIALRSQSYNVIVCRDAGAWLGPETGSGQGNVDLNPGWEDEDGNTPRDTKK